MNNTKHQPKRTVNCSCCGVEGERDKFYHDKINDRWACVDLSVCMRRVGDRAFQDAQDVMLKRAYANNPIDDPELAEAQKAETWIRETIREAQKRLNPN